MYINYQRIDYKNVDGTEIQVLQIEEGDYISLTDMARKIDNYLTVKSNNRLNMI